MGKPLGAPHSRRRLGTPPPATSAPQPAKYTSPFPQTEAGSGLGIVATRELHDPVTVSVITPTRHRPERHPALYEVFRQQDWPNADLWVFDDSPEPSAFLLETSQRDERVHYLHAPSRAMKIG